MNVGKIFEAEIKKSIPKDVYYFRIKDNANSWANNKKSKFTSKNPYDIILFKHPNMYALELKSTSSDRISFDMIQDHQIDGLTKAANKGIIAGLLFNFRAYNTTLFVHIYDFLKYQQTSKIKSIPIKKLLINHVIIPSTLKKVYYTYDISNILNYKRTVQ